MEERYKQKKEMHYFHPSYMGLEKMTDWSERARAEVLDRK